MDLKDRIKETLSMHKPEVIAIVLTGTALTISLISKQSEINGYRRAIADITRAGMELID